MLKKDSLAGIIESTRPNKNAAGCRDFSAEIDLFLRSTELMIREIPQGEKEETTALARSQKSSLLSSWAEPAAIAQATQKIHEERMRENTRKLLFELRLGLFENATAPTPATNSDKAYVICGLTTSLVLEGGFGGALLIRPYREE